MGGTLTEPGHPAVVREDVVPSTHSKSESNNLQQNVDVFKLSGSCKRAAIKCERRLKFMLDTISLSVPRGNRRRSRSNNNGYEEGYGPSIVGKAT